jgi:putative FmdB family regulatory protein
MRSSVNSIRRMRRMPVYAFRCPNGHEVEELVPMSKRDEPMPCVACHEKDGSIVEMQRVPTTFSGRVIGGTPTHFPGRVHK